MWVSSKNVIVYCLLTTVLTLTNLAGAENTIMPVSVIKRLNVAALNKFNTRNLQGSYGLDVDVYYPECMKFERGGFQTHTVAKSSYEWNDYEVLVQIMVSAFNPGVSKVAGVREAFGNVTDKSELADWVPSGGRFLDGGITNIRDVKVAWFDYEKTVERMGESSRGAYRVYMVPADSGYILNLQMAVSCATEKSPLNDFRALAPMMNRCAVALTLKDYSQFSMSAEVSKKIRNISVSSDEESTILPSYTIRELNADALKYYTLATIKSLDCKELDITMAFPKSTKVEVDTTQEDKALKATRDWPEYNLRFMASVSISNVGYASVSGLRAALKQMRKRDLEKACVDSLGAKFLDGGIVDEGDVLYSWIDMVSVDRRGYNSVRMLTVPAWNGKNLTISYAVASMDGKKSTENDFIALMPLIKRCQESLIFRRKERM